MINRFFILPIVLGSMLVACGGEAPTGAELDVDQIESRLETPTDFYKMESETIAQRLLAFPALTPQEAEALAAEIKAFDLTENADVLGETAAPSADPSTGEPVEPPPSADDPNLPKPCPRGLIKGQWKHVGNGFGVFRGAFVAPNGELLGYVRGVYGKHRMVGKVVTKDGQPHSLLMGVYGASFFRARLVTRDGIQGALGGRYGQNVFIGKWRIFCNKPDLVCPPAMMPHPAGLFCVPKACVPGSCPVGFYCDLCPSICKDAIAAGANACAAVCGQPVCRPRVVLPKPGDDGPQCAEVMLGGALSCKPTDIWKKYAEGLCTAKGGILAAFGVGLPCGDDAYHVSRLICCRPQADASLPVEPAPEDPASGDDASLN